MLAVSVDLEELVQLQVHKQVQGVLDIQVANNLAWQEVKVSALQDQFHMALALARYH
jgi:hypothetical protein